MKKNNLPNMFYGANPEIFRRAKELRKNMTECEQKLWSKLNNKQLGVRFKPQHPIDIFIADFYCHECKLVIEIDGKIHEMQKDYDEGRTVELSRWGLNVIRFTNEEIINEIEKVVETIKKQINLSFQYP